MSHTTAFTNGLADRLVAGGATLPVTIGPMLGDAAGIAIIPFPVEDDADTAVSLQGAQIRIRGAKLAGAQAVLEAQDLVYDVVTSISDELVGDKPVLIAWRDRSLPVVSDSDGRYDIRDTYYFRTDR